MLGFLTLLGCLAACLPVGLGGVKKSCGRRVPVRRGGRAPSSSTFIFTLPGAGGMNVSLVLEPFGGPPGRSEVYLSVASRRSLGGSTAGPNVAEQRTRRLDPVSQRDLGRASLLGARPAGPARG